MTLVKVKGYEFNAINVRDSANRRAQRFKTNILTSLRQIGLTEDDVEVKLEPVAIKRLPASASWYVENQHLHYSYAAGAKYVDNLYVVAKIIEFEVQAILEGTKTIDQFIRDFNESYDVQDERKAARELLEVEPDCLDLNIINKKFKKMSLSVHPDMGTGDTEKFKALNHAHKILKRELD